MVVNNIDYNIAQSDSNGQNKVGVVIVNWNDLKNTRDCLNSLRNQRYRNFEIIVVDNGSKDGSADLLEKEFPGLIIIRLPENTGFVGGSNCGIRVGLKRKCSYFLLLNNDTVVDEYFLEEMVKVASNNPLCGMVNPTIYYFMKPNIIQSMGIDFNLWIGIPRMRSRKTLDRGQFSNLVEVSSAVGCALLVKTEVINKIGFLDEKYFAYAEDIDWSLRARKAGYSILIAPMGKVWHKEEYGWRKYKNQSLRLYLSTRNGLWLIHKHGEWFQWITALPNYLCKWVGKFVLLSLLRRDPRSAWAVVEGILGFYRLVWNCSEIDEIEKRKIIKYANL